MVTGTERMRLDFMAVKGFGKLLIVAAGIGVLSGCSSDGGSTVDASPGGSSPVITMPGNASNPPVTMSGYVDTSATTQVR